jgi:hypothetical protein
MEICNKCHKPYKEEDAIYHEWCDIAHAAKYI